MARLWDIYDEIEIELEFEGAPVSGDQRSLLPKIELSIHTGKGAKLPVSELSGEEPQKNLAYRAVGLFLKNLPTPLKRMPSLIRLSLFKGIPWQAGLGGGSSDAAEILLHLNRYFNLPYSEEEILSLGASIGSDVSFFMKDRICLVEGLGEVVTPLSYQEIGGYALVFKPPYGLSTQKVYQNLQESTFTDPKTWKEQSSVFTKPPPFILEQITEFIYNALEQTALLLEPRLTAWKERILNQGARQVVLAGSGSALVGLFDQQDEALKARAELMKIASSEPSQSGFYCEVSRY